MYHHRNAIVVRGALQPSITNPNMCRPRTYVHDYPSVENIVLTPLKADNVAQKHIANHQRTHQ